MEGKEVYEGEHSTGLLFCFEVSLGLQRGEWSSVVEKVQYRHRFAGGFGHGGEHIHVISWS